MKKFAILGLVLAGGMLFAAGCGGGSSSSSKTVQLRMVNANPYVVPSSYDFLVAGTSFTTGLQFGSSSAYATVASGTSTIEVRNNGVPNDVISQSVTLTGGDNYSFVAVGTSSQTPSGVLLTDNNTVPTSGNVAVRVINACDAVGPMDVYINPAGTNLFSVTANVSNLAFGAGSGYQSIAAGSIEIRLQAPGDKSATGNRLDFTSTLAAGGVITVVASDVVAGFSPCTYQQLTDLTT